MASNRSPTILPPAPHWRFPVLRWLGCHPELLVVLAAVAALAAGGFAVAAAGGGL